MQRCCSLYPTQANCSKYLCRCCMRWHESFFLQYEYIIEINTSPPTKLPTTYFSPPFNIYVLSSCNVWSTKQQPCNNWAKYIVYNHAQNENTWLPLYILGTQLTNRYALCVEWCFDRKIVHVPSYKRLYLPISSQKVSKSPTVKN